MMRVKREAALVVLVGLGLLVSLVRAASADVPPRSHGGQALVVPSEHLDLGDVYYVSPSTGTQLTWTADAPLRHVVATCHRVVGYFVAPFDVEEGQAPLVAGAVRIPVASLRTGMAGVDGEFHGQSALDAKEYPEITLEITGVANSKPVEGEAGKKAYTLDATCQFTVKDKTLELELPLRVTLMPFTWQTMPLGMGDALILRTEFDVQRADLPMQAPPRPNSDLHPESHHLEFFLVCNTMSPERNLYPDISHDVYRKQLRFITLLRDFNDAEKGYEFGRAFRQEIWDDPQALNRLAAATLDEAGIETRDLAFVLRAAQRANDLTESKDPELLSTLARVYYEKGELATAIKWARQAVENVGDAAQPISEQLRETLQRYESQAEESQAPPESSKED